MKGVFVASNFHTVALKAVKSVILKFDFPHPGCIYIYFFPSKFVQLMQGFQMLLFL